MDAALSRHRFPASLFTLEITESTATVSCRGELKIDQSFVQREGSTGHALIAAVVGVSRGLGLRVVAEGEETDAQLRMVRDPDCDCAQGYLLGKPTARADMELSLLGRILDA